MRQRHPAGLYVLFFTEMWERFSFYTMAAVFMYYLRDPMWEAAGHTWLRDSASLINGLYFGTVYFSPFFGGILADRKVGYFWAIVWGAGFFCLGEFILAVPNVPCLFLGLLGLILGNGLFKPNISTLVGKLYAQDDPRRDDAYIIFYMGINIGALIAPIVAGYLSDRHGYSAAFGAAGVGMMVALAIFVACRGALVLTDSRQADTSTESAEDPPPAVQRERHVALLIIFAIVILFWMVFTQNGNTLPLWYQNYTDRTPPTLLEGTALLDKKGKITAALNAAINPFFVIVLSPLMVLVWSGLRRRGREPTTPAKIGLGMLFAAAGFVVLMAGGFAGADQEYLRQKPIRAELRRQLNLLNRLVGAGTLKQEFLDARIAKRKELLAIQAELDSGAFPGPRELNRLQANLDALPAATTLEEQKQRDSRQAQLKQMQALLTAAGSSSAGELTQVTPWFLIGALVLVTLGELCVSPLGLSLVSKLAARRSRAAWMGGWFAATAIGGYLSGLIGWFWEAWPPSQFFGVMTGAVLFAALLLLIFMKKLNAAMPAVSEQPTPAGPVRTTP